MRRKKQQKQDSDKQQEQNSNQEQGEDPKFTGLSFAGERKRSQSLQTISIQSIYVAEQFRKYFDPDEIDKLATAISKNGFQGSIIVKELNEKDRDKYQKAPHKLENSHNYLLIVGESRLRAMKQLKRLQIPAEVKPANLDIKVVRRLQADENLVRNDLNPLEESETIFQMMVDELNIPPKEIEKLIDSVRHGKEELPSESLSSMHALQAVLYRYKGETTRSTPAAFLQQLRRLRSLDGKLLEALQAGVAASKLLEIKSLKSKEEQEKLLQRLQDDDDLTVKQIRNQVRKLNEAKKLPQQTDTDSVEPIDNSHLKTSLKAAVSNVMKKKNWQRISEDKEKREKMERLLSELKALIEG